MLLILLYSELKKNNNISDDLLKKILNINNIHIRPIYSENILVVKKNYDKEERIISDLIDDECLKKELNECQLYDSNDDILTLAYKLALLKNDEYMEIIKNINNHKKNTNKSNIFNILNILSKFLIYMLIIVFIILAIIYIIKRIRVYITKR